MPPTPPPNESLAELAASLGVDNVRTLVRTFLREFPNSFAQLTGGERQNRHRIAHSMKSNSRLVGAHGVFNANRDQLTNPDQIKPGQVLKIPQTSRQ